MRRNERANQDLADIAAAGRVRNQCRDQVIDTAVQLRAAIDAHPDLLELTTALAELDAAEEQGRRLVARINGSDQEALL